MKTLREKIMRIVFEYGVGMVSDQTKLLMGSLSSEEAEKSQGKKTAQTIEKIYDLIKKE